MKNQRTLSYGRQDISEADIAAVVAVLRGDCLTQGPAIDSFEAGFAEYVGAKYAVACSNGTAGLHIAYLAAGLTKGDAVIVPSLTFAATANAVLYCGAVPVFADVEPTTGEMSLSSAYEAYQLATKAGLRVRGIVPVHYAGRPCSMADFWNFAEEFKLFVVEDACHSLGAEYRRVNGETFQKVGSSTRSLAAVFSFHPVKHITTGEGGMVTTSDPELYKRLKRLRSHGITKVPTDFENKKASYDEISQGLNPWYHEMLDLGYNYRISDIQAALGSSQLQRIKANVERRREIAAFYGEGLKDLPGIELPAGDNDHALHSYHLYPIKIDFDRIGQSRRQVMARLGECGIGTQVHYIPVPNHPFYQKYPSLWRGTPTPNAETFYRSELSIPMYPTLTRADTSRVVSELTAIVRGA